MQRILLFISIYLAINTAAYAQQLVLDSTLFIGGDTTCGISSAQYAIHTRDGGILFVGKTECWGGGDIPTNWPDSFYNAGLMGNVLIGKVDSNMNISWIKVYGGSRFDLGMSAVQTADGGYAVLCTTWSNDLDVTGNHMVGDGDYWLIRLDSSGNFIWGHCYGSIGDDEASSIALTPDGGFILVGASNDSGGDVPYYYNTFDGNYDWFVVKTDSMGNIQWAKVYGGNGDESEWGQITILSIDTTYYIAGWSTSTSENFTDTSWHIGVSTGPDYYLLKINSSGEMVWNKSYGGTDADECYQAFFDSRDSTILMTGFTESTNYMVTGHNGNDEYANDNAWVIKVDRNGNLLTENCVGDNMTHYNPVYGNSTCINSNGGYMTLATIDFGPIGKYDAWLIATDSNLQNDTNIIFGGKQFEENYSIIPYKSGFSSIGYSTSNLFTQGINIDTNVNSDIYVSYFTYITLGINSIKRNNLLLEIFPNPAIDKITISIQNNFQSTCILNIYDDVSKLIYTNMCFKFDETLDIKSWHRGAYIAVLTDENGNISTKQFILN